VVLSHIDLLLSKFWLVCAKAKGNASPDDDALVHGVTGNRTQNLLHSTDAVKHDAKKMSYH
jgi:hypothetical protein